MGGSEHSETRHRGIGRLEYIVGFCGIMYLYFYFMRENSHAVSGIGLLAVVLLAFNYTWRRLANIGMNKWWILLIFLPLVNIFIIYRGMVYPAGWQDSHRLDTAGKVLKWSFIAGVLVYFIVLGYVLPELQ
ncbi:hypothetical protein JW948_08430 [bacterium]|nr:hypothetical protein [bacterium]